MKIQENIPLAQLTTFKTGGSARFFCSVADIDDAKQAVAFARENKVSFFVLGGGSNLLISDAGFNGLVIKVDIKGKEVKKRGDGTEIIRVGAGEMWDLFVQWTIDQGFNGLENLSAIPGTVGAVPVQNIGAYGAEASRFVDSVHAFDAKEMKEVDLNARECCFGYRNSLFKHEKGRYIVLHVDFTLKKDGKVNLEYKDVKEYFKKKENTDPTPSEVREAIIDIRWNKLPDWNKWGTAGSFFKNPVVSQEKYDQLKKSYPDLPGFLETDSQGKPVGIKLSLGWVLDHICKAKGMMNGAVGTYDKQALVIVAKAGATSSEVVRFTEHLMDMVKEKTGITIEAEVEWVN